MSPNQKKKKKIPTASCRFSQRIALRFRWMQWFTIGYQMRPSLSRTWRMLTIRPGYWHRLLYETQWELGICMRYSASVWRFPAQCRWVQNSWQLPVGPARQQTLSLSKESSDFVELLPLIYLVYRHNEIHVGKNHGELISRI